MEWEVTPSIPVDFSPTTVAAARSHLGALPGRPLDAAGRKLAILEGKCPQMSAGGCPAQGWVPVRMLIRQMVRTQAVVVGVATMGAVLVLRPIPIPSLELGEVDPVTRV